VNAEDTPVHDEACSGAHLVGGGVEQVEVALLQHGGDGVGVEPLGVDLVDVVTSGDGHDRATTAPSRI